MSEIQIVAEVTHISGPELPDPHVMAWICADGQVFEHVGAHITFEVCPTHADPDTCGCTTPPAIYGFAIGSADVVG